jgi:hypothetical protein
MQQLRQIKQQENAFRRSSASRRPIEWRREMCQKIAPVERQTVAILKRVMQAYVDESGNQPGEQFFVVAGFVASSTQWLAFTSDWSAVLQQNPSIAYFKYNEALGMKNEFTSRRGWDEKSRNKKN